MMGAQDFCGHYEWTFEYLRRTHGQAVLEEYWRDAIGFDSQRHAAALIRTQGFDGMDAYWGHSLTQEQAGYSVTRTPDAFRLDIHACPSKGYLLEHGLAQHEDYCAHCMGWIGPVAETAGFAVDHEHNHRAQCWWILYDRAVGYDSARLTVAAGEHRIELAPGWSEGEHHPYKAGQLQRSVDAQPALSNPDEPQFPG